MPDVPGQGVTTLTGLTDLSPSNLFAVGAYRQTPQSTPYPLAEHWNGSAWSIIPSVDVGPGDTFLGGIAAVIVQGRVISPSEALAVGGTFLDAEDSTSQPLAECYCSTSQ